MLTVGAADATVGDKCDRSASDSSYFVPTSSHPKVKGLDWAFRAYEPS